MSSWPRWTIPAFALVLIFIFIILGLILEPVGQALATQAEPTPTLPSIGYAKPESTECEECHFDMELLTASVDSGLDAEAGYIDPASLLTTHGRLGCVTCHEGNGLVDAKEEGHVELVSDPTALDDGVGECLLCHRSMPDVIPEDRLKTPHGEIIRMEEGVCDVPCSACHGGVGHGFDLVTGGVVCSMNTCLDCHQERNLDIQLEDCNVCHIGPHDVAEVLNCNTCHVSTEVWTDTELAVHPMELVGRHAEIGCFTCHVEPDFMGLGDECSDCHVRPHQMGDDNCSECHSPEGW